MTLFDDDWADRVVASCDPVFAAAAAGFTRQVHHDPDGAVGSLLWEADPLLFAVRYPDSGVEESCGAPWPTPCLDYWLYVDGDAGRLSVEGWNLSDIPVALTGDGDVDGPVVAAEFARILQVPGQA